MIEASTGDWPGAPRRLELNGECGVIILEEDRIVKWEVEGEKGFSLYEQNEEETESHRDPAKIDASGHICQIRNFISALRGESELLVDGKEGRKALEIILSAYASAYNAFHASRRMCHQFQIWRVLQHFLRQPGGSPGRDGNISSFKQHGKEGRKALEIILSAYASAETGKAVVLSI